MVTITLVDNGADRYTLEASDFCLGRRYDNNAEKVVVVKPTAEAGHACTMIVTHNGEGVDRISVGDAPVDIQNILSQYESVEIGFCFTGENDYLKNSEIKTFYFGDAQSPEDFTPVDPEIETDLLYVIANALVGLGLSSNTLQARNKAGAVTSSVDLTAFKNTNIKFGNQVIDNVNIKDFASGINMSLDPTNYKLTITLVDGNDVVLSTQTVDLPSENAIVDARLSQDGKKITFILQSGNTFDVDVSSIVSGLIPDTRTIAGLRLNQDISKASLQTALEDSTHKFVTDEKKTKLDNLANIKEIGDNLTLDENGRLDATGGGSGGTTDYTDLSNKPSINSTTLSGNKTSSDLGLQPTIDSSHKLDADLVSDTNSTNKFVTATDKQTWSGKQDPTSSSLTTTSNSLVGAINEVNSIAKGASVPLKYDNYSAMITAFNALNATAYNVGQNVMIVTLEVPDLWISSVEGTSSTYTYTTDEAFTTALATNGYVQVGYYKLSALETQKVDLTGYVQKTTTIAGVDLQDNITKSEMQTALNVEDGAQVNTMASISAGGTALTPDANKNVNIPTASANDLGVLKVKTYSQSGLLMEGGFLYAYPASSTQITNKTNTKCQLTPNNIDLIVKVGVTTNTNTLTDTEQTNACNWLGTGKMVTLTQAQYDALVLAGTVDANTYYFIEEE